MNLNFLRYLVLIQFKIYFRQPETLFWSFGFPLILFWILGLAFKAEYLKFFIPGLLALNIMNGALWGVGWGMVELRMKKYIKRLSATPMSRVIFLSSYISTRICISLIETGLLLLAAKFIFGISLKGNPILFLIVFLMGNFVFAGISILIGSRADNMVTANGLLNVVMLPMMLTSGIFFSYDKFPKIVIPIIRYFPLTLLADSLRAVFSNSIHFSQLGLACCILGILGLITFIFGIRIFKWH